MYLFETARLGFRNWQESDKEDFITLNLDSKVREFFPGIASEKESVEFIERMKASFARVGFCYFAVDRLDCQEFIGFIGLYNQSYEAPFTPCVDIGWRLKQSAWGNGFATEGAKKCLLYAQNNLNLSSIYSVAPKINYKSIAVMEKIGLEKLGEFIHPSLEKESLLNPCVYYGLS